ncbi:MAG: efflux RND transporter periplasmic adaptor subunit [Bacteroidales bacterium]|nr:efflux RND transporter periplasmic adaptor subunit [Bacteroidales bacterium]
MKKNIIYIFAVVFVLSCTSTDKRTKLKNLEKQQNEISEQIKSLKKEIESTKKPKEQIKNNTAVLVEKILPLSFNHFIEVQGNVESDNNILIPAQTSAIVKNIFVEEGDKVEEGQLLAELDGSINEKSMDELNTSLELATTVFERQKRLWDKKIGSEISFLQAKSNKESLEKKLETVKEQYDLTKITSPINGTIDNILIKEGEMAVAGMGVIRVVELSKLKIITELSESYISQVKKNDIVTVYFPVVDKSIKLSINSISQVINPDNRTFSVEIIIPEKEKNIKPNMLSELTIKDYTNNNALVVPLNIVQKTGEEEFLFVAKQNNKKWHVEKRIVKTGKNYNNKVEILSGLSPNEYVAVVGYQDLTDGEAVEVKE